MTQAFNIRYFDPGRQAVVQETAHFESQQHLLQDCAQNGRVLLESKALAPSKADGRDFDVAWWCRELRTLLHAGMTVPEAMETLLVQSKGGRREQVHSALLRSLRAGQSLSRAMRSTEVFPQVLIASVTASERTSTLTDALEDFLRYDEMLQRLRRQVISAAIYPAVVMALGTVITAFLMLYVIPRFSKMYVDYRGEVSLPTQTVLWISRTLHAQWPWVLGLALTFVSLLVWAFQQGHAQRMLASALRAIPFLDRQWMHYRHAKLYQSLALMFKGGYTLDEALIVCEGLGLGAQATHGISQTRAELARGRSVAHAFARGALTDPVSERLLAVGERTGGFDAVLQTIADRHAQTFATFIERATRIVEPLLLLLVALTVGGIIVLMYMPIFDMANGIR